MINTKIRKTAIFSLIVLTSNLFSSGLPENISDLVEDAAPAVVNITSKREVKQSQSFNYGGIPDESWKGLVFQGNTENLQREQENQYHMALVLFSRITTS